MFALEETGYWRISAMHVPGHIVYGRDLGKTAIFCPRQVKHFRRSWISHDRITAILVGSTMIMSVYMPHSGYDEEEYSATLDAVWDILLEGKNQERRISSLAVISILHSNWTMIMKTVSIGIEFTDPNAAAEKKILLHMRRNWDGCNYWKNLGALSPAHGSRTEITMSALRGVHGVQGSVRNRSTKLWDLVTLLPLLGI